MVSLLQWWRSSSIAFLFTFCARLKLCCFGWPRIFRAARAELLTCKLRQSHYMPDKGLCLCDLLIFITPDQMFRSHSIHTISFLLAQTSPLYILDKLSVIASVAFYRPSTKRLSCFFLSRTSLPFTICAVLLCMQTTSALPLSTPCSPCSSSSIFFRFLFCAQALLSFTVSTLIYTFFDGHHRHGAFPIACYVYVACLRVVFVGFFCPFSCRNFILIFIFSFFIPFPLKFIYPLLRWLWKRSQVFVLIDSY